MKKFKQEAEEYHFSLPNFLEVFQISFNGSPNRKDTPAVSVRGKFYTYATFYGVRFIVKDIEVPKKC